MLEPKRPLKVFLCHSSTDKPKVRELYRYLKRRGINPWFDEEHLVGGQDWQIEIPKALATSDAIIICLTKNSVDKEGYIQKEIKFALDKALEMPEGRIFLIPVKFEECEVPFSLSRYQWVDLTVESGYAKMMKALKFRASQLERNTVQLPKNEIDEEKLSIERVSRERAEKEAAEKARLEVDEEKRQKAAKEKAEREVAEREKAELKALEKAAKEKEEVEKEIKRRLEKSIKKAKRDLWWGKLKIDIQYRFQVINIYRVPILILLVMFAILTPLLIRTSNLIPEIITTLNNTPTATIDLTLAPQSSTTPTEAFIPLEILTPSPTSTEVLVVIPTSLPTEITDAKGVSMALVSSNGVQFYMDKYEVTNKLYKTCVDAGYCLRPLKEVGYTADANSNYPIVYVNQIMADTYCKWRDTRLPTSDEWNMASEGFPWEKMNDCNYGNYIYGFKLSTGSTWTSKQSLYCVGRTVSVGSYELGKSTFGIYDLVGNVSEWASEVNDNGYYQVNGGSWNNYFSISENPTLSENINTSERANNTIGFRCAKDAP